MVQLTRFCDRLDHSSAATSAAGFAHRGAGSHHRFPIRRSIDRRAWPIVICGILLTACAGLANAAAADDHGFRWQHEGIDRLLLEENGQPVLAFQLAPRSLEGKFPRANYIHPLYDTDGVIVTEDFPADHRHHRGIFWAWHQLLWHEQPTSDPWICKDIEWLPPERDGVWLTTRAAEASASMRVVRDWAVPDPTVKTPARPRTIRLVRSTVSVTAHAAHDHQRTLDFEIRLRALVPDVSLGGADNVKGYGGFSTRVRLAGDTQFTGPHGSVQPRPMAAVEAGPWVDCLRTIDGKLRGVAIMVHPSHPGFPLKWILRPKGSSQNPEWPGREPVPLSDRCDCVLRYRIVLHVGKLDTPTLNHSWRHFAGTEEH